MEQRRKGSSNWLGCMYVSGRGLDGDCLLTSVTGICAREPLVAPKSSWHRRALQKRSRPRLKLPKQCLFAPRLGFFCSIVPTVYPGFVAAKGEELVVAHQILAGASPAPRLKPRRH